MPDQFGTARGSMAGPKTTTRIDSVTKTFTSCLPPAVQLPRWSLRESALR